MIDVSHVGKAFGAVRAVTDASFTAPDGTITGILGENGAGKTTTLAMICGLVQPDAGSIRVGPAESTPLERRRCLGALLDHKGLYGRLTARENITYFGELHGMCGARLAQQVQEVLSQLGLEEIADRRAAGFSQGERMKVALARAIVHSPAHLLLDEPTNGLDIPTVHGLRDLLRRFRDRGTCVVFSSHVLEEVREAASYARAPGERENILQEIALAIWSALPRFRGECSERTFLFRIAHNRAITYLARRRLTTIDADENVEIEDSSLNPETALSSEQQGQRLLDAIHRLPVGHAQVVTLTLEGMRYADIAEVLGISEANVGARLTRARQMLRKLLGNAHGT